MGSRRLARTRSLSGYITGISQTANSAYVKTNEANVLGTNAISESALSEDFTLVDKSLQSNNYIPRESGWKISGTGDAEFGNVYVRGDINASTGTIGYWNISSPAVKRTFGTTTLFGTFLESYDHGPDDTDTITGTYVSLFKSAEPELYEISYVSRDTDVATIDLTQHDFQIGDTVIVSCDTDSTFNTATNSYATVTATTYNTISYSNTGSNTANTAATGTVSLYIEDTAGLYLRDYGKVDFDYGYYSNKGVQFNSPYVVNVVKNPSFEYIANDSSEINDPTTAALSKSSWSFPASSIAESLLGSGTPFIQGVGTSGYTRAPGCVMWRGTAITTEYFKATLDYNAIKHFRLLDSDRTLYFGFDIWVIDYDTPFITTYPSFDISEIKFEFSNGQTVNIYDVLTDECQSEWVSSSTPSWMYYTTSTGGDVLLTRQRPIPRISGGKLLDQYQTLDATGYAAESDILIRFPAYLYSQNTTTVSSFTKTNKILGDSTHAVGYGLDSVYLSTIERFFFGSKTYSTSHGWWKTDSSGYTRNISSPDFASVETTTKWIDLDLNTQTFNLDKVDYLGFDSHSTRTLLSEPSIVSFTEGEFNVFPTALPSEALTNTRISAGTYLEEYDNGLGDVDRKYVDAIANYQITVDDAGVISRASRRDVTFGGVSYVEYESYHMSWAGINDIYSEQTSRAYLGSGAYAAAKVKTSADRSNVTSDVSTYSSTFNVYIDDGTQSETYTLGLSADATVFDFKEPIQFTGTVVDASLTSTGHPFQIGASSGTHMKMDSNELQVVTSTNAATTLLLNPAGGTVSVGNATSTLDVNGPMGYIYGYNNAVTGRDLYVSSAGTVGYLSSTRTVKQNIESANIDVSAILSIDPKTFKYVPGHLASGNEDELQIGFIAEDLHDAGLTLFVDYNENTGEIQGIKYNRYVVALQAVVRHQQSQIDSLESRVAALGG